MCVYGLDPEAQTQLGSLMSGFTVCWRVQISFPVCFSIFLFVPRGWLGKLSPAWPSETGYPLFLVLLLPYGQLMQWGFLQIWKSSTSALSSMVVIGHVWLLSTRNGGWCDWRVEFLILIHLSLSLNILMWLIATVSDGTALPKRKGWQSPSFINFIASI